MTETTEQTTTIGDYIRETRGEISKVVWPTREEAIRWTVIVLIVMLVMTIILSSFDSLFSSILQFIVDSFLQIPG